MCRAPDPVVRRRRRAGFTLLELLVVLAILALLTALAGPRLGQQLTLAERQIALAQIDAFDRALDQYRADTGHYPTPMQGLFALFTQPADEPHWKGPYLRKPVTPDPWGGAYVYAAATPGTRQDYRLLSLGADGAPGGAGGGADIIAVNSK